MSDVAPAPTAPSGPTVAEERRARRRWASGYRPWLLVLGVLVALGLVAVIFVPSTNEEARAVQRMTPSDRQALYRATLGDAEVVCRQAETEDAFRKRCVSSAAFLLDFPECDDNCRVFAHQFAHQPAR